MNKTELRVGNLVELLTTLQQVNLPTGRYGVIEEIRDEKIKNQFILHSDLIRFIDGES